MFMCFVDLEKAVISVPRNVLEWAMRKKGIPEVLVISVMCLYEEQRQESKGILSCQRSLRLMFGYTKDMCCHIFF